MKVSFRSKVFRYAHQIRTNTGKSFAVCLVKAWQLYRLTKDMSRRVVKFAYEKSDGTLRYASGTLKGISDKIKGTGTPNFKSVSYFDQDQGGFRSFKVENLVHIY